MALPGVRLGIVRSISYGLFGKPDQFLPQLRELGAGLVRVYFYWSQVEPEPGRYNFDAVDAFQRQLREAVPLGNAPLECELVEGYASPGRLIEIEVTAIL